MPVVVVPPVPSSLLPPATERRVTGSSVPIEGAIGVIDNGKSLARELMIATVDALRQSGRPVSYELRTKPSAGRVIAADQRAEMLARSRVVISGVGD